MIYVYIHTIMNKYKEIVSIKCKQINVYQYIYIGIFMYIYTPWLIFQQQRVQGLGDAFCRASGSGELIIPSSSGRLISPLRMQPPPARA